MTKQGQSTMDDFMAHVENKAQKRAHLEQLTTRTLESEDVLEKSPLEDLESVTAGYNKTLDQSKYLRVKQSHGFPWWASSGFENWQNV